MTNLNSSNLNLLRSLLDVVLKHTMMLIGLGGFYFDIEELAICIQNICTEVNIGLYTANVYRELQGLCREIGVQGVQIYEDCMYTRNPCNFEISTL